jgi:hypothetical protein
MYNQQQTFSAATTPTRKDFFSSFSVILSAIEQSINPDYATTFSRTEVRVKVESSRGSLPLSLVGGYFMIASKFNFR